MAGPIPLWSQCAVNSTTCFASVGSLPVSFATTFSDMTRRTALTMSTAAWSPVATGRKSRRAAARERRLHGGGGDPSGEREALRRRAVELELLHRPRPPHHLPRVGRALGGVDQEHAQRSASRRFLELVG